MEQRLCLQSAVATRKGPGKAPSGQERLEVYLYSHKLFFSGAARTKQGNEATYSIHRKQLTT
jgi:hypothetical protein